MLKIDIIFTIPLIIIFWILIKTCIPALIKDYFREYYFTLRNDLFNYSLEHNTSLFKSSVYRDLEDRINSTIQYIDKLKLSTIIAFFIARKKGFVMEISKQKDTMQKNFIKEIEKVADSNDVAFIRKLKRKIEFSLGLYFIFSSCSILVLFVVFCIVLFISSIPIFLFSLIFDSSKSILNKITQITKDYVLNNIRMIEASACIEFK